uniref:Uncharacterized protein n=1 Tax=Pipistrellus kuhlii TaxID=59472 RepID=A0A7J7V133_PIPKU|nr:hypothetical protein mPipKuh1_008668 [Pipistrellus kuhlii]
MLTYIGRKWRREGAFIISIQLSLMHAEHTPGAGLAAASLRRCWAPVTGDSGEEQASSAARAPGGTSAAWDLGESLAWGPGFRDPLEVLGGQVAARQGHPTWPAPRHPCSPRLASWAPRGREDVCGPSAWRLSQRGLSGYNGSKPPQTGVRPGHGHVRGGAAFTGLV